MYSTEYLLCTCKLKNEWTKYVFQMFNRKQPQNYTITRHEFTFPLFEFVRLCWFSQIVFAFVCLISDLDARKFYPEMSVSNAPWNQWSSYFIVWKIAPTSI